jgi:hypothetical protein
MTPLLLVLLGGHDAWGPGFKGGLAITTVTGART